MPGPLPLVAGCARRLRSRMDASVPRLLRLRAGGASRRPGASASVNKVHLSCKNGIAAPSLWGLHAAGGRSVTTLRSLPHAALAFSPQSAVRRDPSWSEWRRSQACARGAPARVPSPRAVRLAEPGRWAGVPGRRRGAARPEASPAAPCSGTYPSPAPSPSRAKSPALGAPGTPQAVCARLCPVPPVHPPAGPVPRVLVAWRRVLWCGIDTLHPISSLGDRHLELERSRRLPLSACRAPPLVIGGEGGECRRGFNRAPRCVGRAAGEGDRGAWRRAWLLPLGPRRPTPARARRLGLALTPTHAPTSR